MSQTVTLEGTIQPDGTLVLEGRVPLRTGRVRVTVEPVPDAAPQKLGLIATFEKIWAEQRARGYVPRTREEIDAELQAMDDEAEGEMQALERLHEECSRRELRPE